jgi:hypothetical protein
MCYEKLRLTPDLSCKCGWKEA